MNISVFANMAKLNLTVLSDKETAALESKAAELIEGFAALDKVDAAGVAPMATVLTLTNVLREDRAQKFITREKLLENAPEHHDGYFSVPRTI